MALTSKLGTSDSRLVNLQLSVGSNSGDYASPLRHVLTSVPGRDVGRPANFVPGKSPLLEDEHCILGCSTANTAEVVELAAQANVGITGKSAGTARADLTCVLSHAGSTYRGAVHHDTPWSGRKFHSYINVDERTVLVSRTGHQQWFPVLKSIPTFSGSSALVDVQVRVNGVLQATSAYTVSATGITFASPVALGAVVDILARPHCSSSYTYPPRYLSQEGIIWPHYDNKYTGTRTLCLPTSDLADHSIYSVQLTARLEDAQDLWQTSQDPSYPLAGYTSYGRYVRVSAAWDEDDPVHPQSINAGAGQGIALLPDGYVGQFGYQGILDQYLPIDGSAGIPSSLTFGVGGKVDTGQYVEGSAGLASDLTFGAGGTVQYVISGDTGFPSELTFGEGGALIQEKFISGATGLSLLVFGDGGELIQDKFLVGSSGLSLLAFGAGGYLIRDQFIVGVTGFYDQSFGVGGDLYLPRIEGSAGMPSSLAFGQGGALLLAPYLRTTQVVEEVLSKVVPPGFRITQITAEALVQPETGGRVSQVVVEVLAKPTSGGRFTQVAVEVLSKVRPGGLRLTQVVAEALVHPNAYLRVTQVSVEALIKIPAGSTSTTTTTTSTTSTTTTSTTTTSTSTTSTTTATYTTTTVTYVPTPVYQRVRFVELVIPVPEEMQNMYMGLDEFREFGDSVSFSSIMGGLNPHDRTSRSLLEQFAIPTSGAFA